MSAKLSLLTFAVLLPMGALMVLSLADRMAERRFAVTELHGLRLAESLLPVLKETQVHRGLTARTLAGDAAAVAQRDDARKAIKGAVAAFDGQLAQLPDVPRLRLPNPEPVFLPLGSAPDDGHRERRLPNEMPTADVSPALAASLAPIARALARRRPDLMCLMSVPFAVQAAGELPAPATPWLALAQQAAGLGDALRQVQWLYPYLRGPGRPLVSASGMVAGLQARVAQRFGPWRSAAARALPAGALPWPPASAQQAAAWRAAGLSVLVQRNGRAMLDDEALPVPVLPGAALANMPSAQRERADWRSAEVQRFMGWLRRELQALGERLLFDVDAQDPRPEQALRHFFTQLHAAGALRGARPEQAFRIQAVAAGNSAESTLAFEIELAPAFPIDLIRISFMHDRADGTARVDASLVASLDGDTGHG